MGIIPCMLAALHHTSAAIERDPSNSPVFMKYKSVKCKVAV